jgi:hypothetical protein
MRMLFGVVGLLVALAIVGLLAVKQLRATGQAVSAALPAAAGPVASGASAATVREQAQQIQQKVKADVTRLLEQGAASRREEAGQ